MFYDGRQINARLILTVKATERIVLLFLSNRDSTFQKTLRAIQISVEEVFSIKKELEAVQLDMSEFLYDVWLLHKLASSVMFGGK